MKKIAVTIPTYWSWETTKENLPEDAVFDHPTPLNLEGTLDTTLNSLKGLAGGSFYVILITAPVNPRISGQAEEKIERIIEPYKSIYPVMQFGPEDLKYVQEILIRHNCSPDIISLEAYAQIRNCQLFTSALLDAELIAAVDDDEIVPPDYLIRAQDYAGKEVRGKTADGIAGIYLNTEGDYRLKEPAGSRRSENIFIKKAALMNDEFSKYMLVKERPVESAVALGGNMVFTRDLYIRVPFDPGITRGEDIDYLINSRMSGYNWFFDKELFITHLPPASSGKFHINTTPYAKLQRDILRFVYEKEKIKLSQKIPGFTSVRAEELGFYPGEFLKEGLEDQALDILNRERPEDADERFFPRPEVLLNEALERAGNASKYFNFAKKWRETVERAAEITELKDYIKKKLDI
ncbi:MAG: hypothetical protein GXP33_05840 [Spirochaetes bacterium]|nr:hypothetical protein [Spirochaetota bacterium]